MEQSSAGSNNANADESEQPGAAGGSAYQVVQWLATRDEVETAVQLYEDMSAAQRERLLKEASAATVEERKGLVEVLRKARDFTGAARLLQGFGSDAEAAALFEQGGNQVEAAEAYLRAGRHRQGGGGAGAGRRAGAGAGAVPRAGRARVHGAVPGAARPAAGGRGGVPRARQRARRGGGAVRRAGG